MRKIVIDMQNYLFADVVAAAFKSSDYDIEVIRAESPRDTVELCQIYEPFVLVMEVTGYAPWKLGERLRLRGEDINLMQTQKLADGNCICRKNCRSRGFKVYDYVHGNLSGVKAHLDQVERGTKLWDHYFVPRLKTKDKNQKLTRFGAHLYVAEDIGLVAFTQVDYKILIFGKTTRACVYRIADLRNYKYEEQMVRNGDKTEKKSTVRMVFINTAGMNAFNLEVNNFKEYEKLSKYFDTLFGVQKTLGNAANTWKQQMTAIKDVASGLSAAMRGEEDAGEKAAAAINSLDAAVYGDRTEWIRRADAALAAFNG